MSHNPMGSPLRNSAGRRRAGLLPVRLSTSVLNEYDDRCPECVPQWLRNVPAGVYWLERSDAEAMHADAVFNADAKGGPEDMPAGTRAAYRALAAQLAKLLGA